MHISTHSRWPYFLRWLYFLETPSSYIPAHLPWQYYSRADVLSPVDDRDMAPLDYALYFRQIPCADFLRSLGGEGYLSKKETADASK